MKQHLLATVLCLSALPALAHPRLVMAGPAPGSVITAPPRTIRIQFSEGIVPAFSGITVKSADGTVQATGPAGVSDKKLLAVPLTNALPPGKYTVEWHAVGDDTHPQKGTFTFEIRP